MATASSIRYKMSPGVSFVTARSSSRLKALEWQISEYQNDGVRAELIAQAEKQKIALRELAQRVEARIAERKAKGKSPSQK